MNAVLICLMLAAEPIDIGEITETEGIAIQHCHAGDRANIVIEPVHPDARHVGGQFSTTNQLLVLKPLSMLSSGTNIAHISTVCAGFTSEVSTVRFVIRRPIEAPKVRRGRVPPPIPDPPMPFAVNAAFPLPKSTNDTYGDYRIRVERALAEGKRRSQ